MSFLDEKNQIERVITFKVNSADQNCLSNWFKDIKPDLLALLEDMLQFNPAHRKSAKELLKHPVFDLIRKQSLEEPSERSVKIPYNENSSEESSVS